MSAPRWRTVDVSLPQGGSRVAGLGVLVEDLTAEERRDGDYGASEVPRRFRARITGAARSVRPRDTIEYDGLSHRVLSTEARPDIGRIDILATAGAD